MVCSGSSSSGTVAAVFGDVLGNPVGPRSCLFFCFVFFLLARFPKLHAAVSSAHTFDDRAKTVELRVTRFKWFQWTYTLCP